MQVVSVPLTVLMTEGHVSPPEVINYIPTP
jgi:hypothetical protein